MRGRQGGNSGWRGQAEDVLIQVKPALHEFPRVGRAQRGRRPRSRTAGIVPCARKSWPFRWHQAARPTSCGRPNIAAAKRASRRRHRGRTTVHSSWRSGGAIEGRPPFDEAAAAIDDRRDFQRRTIVLHRHRRGRRRTRKPARAPDRTRQRAAAGCVDPGRGRHAPRRPHRRICRPRSALSPAPSTQTG